MYFKANENNIIITGRGIFMQNIQELAKIVWNRGLKLMTHYIFSTSVGVLGMFPSLQVYRPGESSWISGEFIVGNKAKESWSSFTLNGGLIAPSLNMVRSARSKKRKKMYFKANEKRS